jgi:hypothetical protein
MRKKWKKHLKNQNIYKYVENRVTAAVKLESCVFLDGVFKLKNSK